MSSLRTPGPSITVSSFQIGAMTLDLSGKSVTAIKKTRYRPLWRSDRSELPSSVANWVVPQGKDFLVGSTLQISSAVGYVHRVFADGTSKLVAEGEQWRNRPLCVTADRSVFWGNGAVRMYAADFSPVGPPVAISAVDGVVGSSTCLAYSTAEAVRLRLSDGAALDSPPLVPSKYQFRWRMSGAYKAGNFVLFWQNDDGLSSFRIRESDGFLLDPDDTFNQKPGEAHRDHHWQRRDSDLRLGQPALRHVVGSPQQPERDLGEAAASFAQASTNAIGGIGIERRPISGLGRWRHSTSGQGRNLIQRSWSSMAIASFSAGFRRRSYEPSAWAQAPSRWMRRRSASPPK